MRLTCPNCGAVYEVPDDAIPEEGRDVQCTNCGHGWFHHPPSARRPTPAPPPLAEDEPEPGPEPTAAVGTSAEEAEDEPLAAPRRPPVDPRTRRILREEAEREAEARRAERRRLRAIEEPAPAPRRAARAPDRIEPPSAAEAGLSPAVAPAGTDARAPERGGGAGFAFGFVATLALVALLAAAYLFPDAVVEAAPGLAEPVAAYVAWVDQARLAVNAAARAASTRLDAFLPSPATGS